MSRHSDNLERIRREAFDDFCECLTGLLDVYRPEGAILALTMPNKHLGDEPALDLIARGETARVLAWIEGARSGVAS